MGTSEKWARPDDSPATVGPAHVWFPCGNSTKDSRRARRRIGRAFDNFHPRVGLGHPRVRLGSAGAGVPKQCVLGLPATKGVRWVRSGGGCWPARPAGALLTMLADTMIPEAYEFGGPTTGLMTVLGFSVAFGISTLS